MKQKAKASLKGGKTKELKVKSITAKKFSTNKNDKMKKKTPAKMMKKSPVKKDLVGKQANLPKELRDKILASPAKMLKPAAMKMMKKSPSKMMKKK